MKKTEMLTRILALASKKVSPNDLKIGLLLPTLFVLIGVFAITRMIWNTKSVRLELARRSWVEGIDADKVRVVSVDDGFIAETIVLDYASSVSVTVEKIVGTNGEERVLVLKTGEPPP